MTSKISNPTSERVDRSSQQIRLEKRKNRRKRKKIDAGRQGSRRGATKSRCKREDFTGSLHAFPQGSKQIRDLREYNLPFVVSRATVLLLMPPSHDLKLHVRAKRMYAPDNPIASPLLRIGSTPTVLRAKLYRARLAFSLSQLSFFSSLPRGLIGSHPLPGLTFKVFRS